MSNLKVQIYEIQDTAEAERVIEAGVDHIGSVLLNQEAWRNPSVADVVRLVRQAGCVSSVIPLFSDPDAVFRVIDYYSPDIIHFCESLSEAGTTLDKCRELISLQEKVKQKFPEISIMRSVPIAPPGLSSHVPTLEIAGLFEPVSDLFLTDTLVVDSHKGKGEQPVSGFVGITGEICDWEMARRLVEESSIPVILAGGLSPENVYDGAVHVCPAGVDSCTQTNKRDNNGKPVRFSKDIEKVERFIRETRRAEAELNNDKKSY